MISNNKVYNYYVEMREKVGVFKAIEETARHFELTLSEVREQLGFSRE